MSDNNKDGYFDDDSDLSCDSGVPEEEPSAEEENASEEAEAPSDSENEPLDGDIAAGYGNDNDDNSYDNNDNDGYDDEDNNRVTIGGGAVVRILKGAGIGVGILLIIFIVACVVMISSIPKDTVAENVYVENLYLGGLSYDDALASIEKTYLLENKNITVSCNGVTYSIVGKDIGIGADASTTADKAFAYGKDGSKLKNAVTMLMLKFKKHVIVPTAVVNDELLDEKLNEFGVMVYGPLVQHEITVGDTSATLIPGKRGYDGDPVEARGEIKWHITYESFDNIDLSDKLKAADPDPISMDRLDGTVYLDPTDAYYEVKNDKVTIVPEVNGRFIDKNEAQAILDVFNASPAEMTVPVYPAAASVKAEDLQAKLFNATLATFSTYYGSSAAGRKTNVGIATNHLNGRVVGPGQTFSFNSAVGHRTTANGFKEAPEYNNGTSQIGIGGGTCQVSTTLFNALLLSDMKIKERYNHSLPVHYVPMGRDATVSDGGADLKFVNSTDYPVKLVTSANGSTCTISVVGTAYSPSRNVQLNVTESNGVYTLTRKVIADGKQIRDTESWRSVYKSQ